MINLSEFKEFKDNGSASEAEIKTAEQAFGITFPLQYRECISQTNGGEGFIGKEYVVLWKASELVEFNHDYEVSESAPGLVFFGSNGGNEGFAFDTRNPIMPIVIVPFIGMSLEDVLLVADTFEDFIDAAINGKFFKD